MESGILLFLLIVSICYGHEIYQPYIPNGNIVPNPCTENSTDTWSRVGHAQLAETPKNLTMNGFGNDFKEVFDKHNGNATLIWPDLCAKDSDGDTKTNGEELGDKACAWRFNSNKPAVIANIGITHPGIPEKSDGSLAADIREAYCGSQR